MRTFYSVFVTDGEEWNLLYVYPSRSFKKVLRIARTYTVWAISRDYVARPAKPSNFIARSKAGIPIRSEE